MAEPHTWHTRYDRSACVVRLHGSIDNQTIFRVCDEIDLAIDYYRYRNIQIEIDSFGGNIDALDYYVAKLNAWRLRRVKIRTVALTAATSAAAYVLVLGDIGSRWAYPSARLQFHMGSLGVNQSSLSGSELLNHAQRLEELDQRFIDHVAYAVASALKEGGHNEYPVTKGGENKDQERLKKAWAQLGIDKIRVTNIFSELDKIKTTIAHLHLANDARITPQVAESLLLIDGVQDSELNDMPP